MRNLKFVFFLFVAVLYSVCAAAQKQAGPEKYHYQPDDQKLYDTIMYLDSVFFEAYNTCNVHLKRYASFFSDSLEFYHDKGGVMTSKQEVVSSTEKFVCGKVTRELVKGSIEVYPIKGYGAVELGLHKFHNNTEPPGTPSETGRFVIIWQRKKAAWKINPGHQPALNAVRRLLQKLFQKPIFKKP